LHPSLFAPIFARCRFLTHSSFYRLAQFRTLVPSTHVNNIPPDEEFGSEAPVDISDTQPSRSGKGKGKVLVDTQSPEIEKAKEADTKQLRKQARKALCPQKEKGKNFTPEQSKIRTKFGIACINAKGRYESLMKRFVENERYKNDCESARRLFEDLQKVRDFALYNEYGSEDDLKASMRRLARHVEIPFGPSQTINNNIRYIVDRINDPQVQAYWQSESES